MALIKQSSIDAVVDACDMLDIVSPYTTLKKAGANYMGRCPFHAEKTPSFSVDPVQKVYYCFGCGEGGNVLTFIRKKEGLDFADAVRWLAEKNAIRIDYEQGSPHQEERFRQRERALSLLDQAASYYARFLAKSSQAREARVYLKRRGFGDAVTREFRLGFSPSGGRALIQAAAGKGYKVGELVDAGLAAARGERSYDRFQGRLMFPFTDHRGRVIGFGARVLDDSKPKYLNSPESDLYHKSRLMFGLGSARPQIIRHDNVLIVEGYTDVLALWQAGIKHAVASMGTALTEQQLREVSRFTKNVYLAFDADAAGQKAMLRALELARKLSLTVRVVQMPAGQDPADMATKDGGAESFLELVAAAPALLEYQVRSVLAASNLETAAGRNLALQSLQNVLAAAATSIERDEQLRIIADRLRLSPENVAYLMESISSRASGGNGQETRRRVLSHEEMTERNFLSMCLAHPGEARRYLRDMTDAYFTTESTQSAFQWVRERLGDGGAGPVLAKPISAPVAAHSILPELIIKSQSGDGESAVALHELYFRLSEAEISRRIGRLKVDLAQGEGSDRFEELCRLEEHRREIIELIQSGNYEA
ncbi:MAG: DNA primase [Actinobacteria bacterium]|nr:DNA primase [Actinomycetota bacterium]